MPYQIGSIGERGDSEELLRALLSTLSDVAFVIDEHGRYRDILAQPQRDGLLAADLSTLKGKLLHDVFPREKADLFLSIVQKTIETQQNQTVEYLLPVQEGERWFEGRTALLHLPGQDKMMIWVSRDITERKQAETALRTNAHFLSESQRLGHVGSFLIDRQGVVSWSDEMYRVYGVSQDTFKPTTASLVGLIHPDDRASMQTWIASCAAGEKPGILDFRINRPDGTVRFIRGNGDAVYDDRGALAFLAGTAQDITRDKQAEATLREKAKELEARVRERTAELEEKTIRAEVASRAKTDFLSNMSHELRTPLNSIIGFSEVLKSGDAGTLTAEQNEYLEDIWTSGKHLSRIIDDMLAFADFGPNEPKQLAGEFAIKEMLEEVISRHAAGAVKQKIKIGTDIADKIGHAVADRQKIAHVVDHLLGNALKFTPAGGTVQVSARRTWGKAEDMELEIAVTDSGIGIAKEDMAQIFQPFEQLAAPLTKTFGGIGLGLAICKKYVEFYGGRIWCESEPGQGSRFAFTLPVTP